MRVDVTVCDETGRRDVAVLAADGAPLAELAAVLPGVPPGPEPIGYPALPAGWCLGSPGEAPRAGHRLVVVGGPAAGRSLPLGRDAVVVGRSDSCDLPLPDPRLSRRHLEIALGVSGPQVRDLGSAHGVTVDGEPAGRGWSELPPGALARAGDTFLEVRAEPVRRLPVRPGPGGTGLVSTGGARGAPGTWPPIELPEPPARPERAPAAWFAALAPAAAGGALAVAMGSWVYALLAVLTPIALLATGTGERWRARRAWRREAVEHARALAAALARVRVTLRAEGRARRHTDPDPARLSAVAAAGVRLWERRPGDEGLLRVRVGLGDAPAARQVIRSGTARPAGTVVDVPWHVDLGAGGVAVCGPIGPARAVGRWLLAQLVAFVAPADLEVVVLTDEAGSPAWRWVRWLPHWAGRRAQGGRAQRALVAELTGEIGGAPGEQPVRPVVLVVDGCPEPGVVAALLERSGPRAVTAVWIDRGGAPPPCPSRIGAADDTATRFRLPTGTVVVADQVSEPWAEQLARALAPLRPDRPEAGNLPATVRLADLVPGERAPWQARVPGLAFVLGCTADGPLVVDLVRDGPHALIAGTTGAGKSELLRTMVAALALAHPPDRLAFVLVDYKGGAAFADCARLPHTAGCVTDLDAQLTARALRSLERELRRREALLARRGVSDLRAYTPVAGEEPVPRLVIAVDEFAALAEELPDFVAGLVGIAQRGRSLGIHLVLATQRPSGVVSPEIRANTGVRIALRVADAADSRDVVDSDDAARLDRRRPGRAVLQVAGGPAVAFQTASVSLPQAPAGRRVRVVELDEWRRPRLPEPPTAGTDLAALVDRLDAAARAQRRPRPAPPWLPPLPARVSAARVAEIAAARARGRGETVAGIGIGLADLPDEQQQRPLLVDLDAGTGVVISGGARSGRTSALLALAQAAAECRSPEQLEIGVVDLPGDLAAVGRLPHTGSVVTDATGAAALLHGLAGLRRTRERRYLLLVDGFEQLSTASEHADGGETVDALLALLRTAASTGTTVALAGDRAVLNPRIAGAAGLRLVLRLTDPADFALAGLAPRAVPGRMPPGRALIAPDGVEVQLAAAPADPDAALARLRARWPEPSARRVVVRALPASIGPAGLRRPDGLLLLGVGGAGAKALAIDPFRGGRLLVCGPPGSGRTGALLAFRVQAVASGWAVVAAAATRSELADVAAADPVAALASVPDAQPVLVLADDAEDLLDTPVEAGLLGALAERDRCGAPTALIATTTSEHAAVAFRGLAAEARRRRCLVVLHPGPAEAALLQTRLPRQLAGQPPGRGVIAGSRQWGPQFAGGPIPIQLIAPPPGPAPTPGACGGSGGRSAGRGFP